MHKNSILSPSPCMFILLHMYTWTFPHPLLLAHHLITDHRYHGISSPGKKQPRNLNTVTASKISTASQHIAHISNFSNCLNHDHYSPHSLSLSRWFSNSFGFSCPSLFFIVHNSCTRRLYTILALVPYRKFPVWAVWRWWPDFSTDPWVLECYVSACFPPLQSSYKDMFSFGN